MKYNGLHTFCIRSSYQDPQLSAARLEITKATMVPSLARQTCKDFQIYLRIHDNDPLFAERWEAWNSIGVPIVRTMDIDHGDGLNLQTRVDDDDAISRDFVRDLQHVASMQRTKAWIVQPLGMMYARGRWHQMEHHANMFASVLLPGPIQIFKETHGNLGRMARRVIVPANRRYWCWVRHSSTASVESDWRRNRPRATLRERQRFSHVSFPRVARVNDQVEAVGELHEVGVTDTDISQR